jgi:hypothetical protein
MLQWTPERSTRALAAEALRGAGFPLTALAVEWKERTPSMDQGAIDAWVHCRFTLGDQLFSRSSEPLLAEAADLLAHRSRGNWDDLTTSFLRAEFAHMWHRWSWTAAGLRAGALAACATDSRPDEAPARTESLKP